MTLAAFADHLWQSTLCAGLAALLVWALRRQPAAVRYRVWLCAGLKFAIPFSLLIALGARLPGFLPAAGPAGGVQTVIVPFASAESSAIAISGDALAVFLDRAAKPVMTIWAAGLLVVLLSRFARVRKVQSIITAATPLRSGREVDALNRARLRLGVRRAIDLRVSTARISPGVFGLSRPMVYWPARLTRRLTDIELETIFLHELAHVRRRDNVISSAFAILQAVFWFNPVVSWIETRLVQERERACDELVLATGAPARNYAASLLKVCSFCLRPPAVVGMSATGSNLNQRVEAIMTARNRSKLDVTRKALLTFVAAALVCTPVAIGALSRQSADLPSVDGRAQVIRLDAVPLAPDGQPIAHDSGWHDVASFMRRSDVVQTPVPAPESPAASSSPAPDPAPAPDPQAAPAASTRTADDSNVLRVGTQVSEPKKIKDARPIYPDVAKANGVQGIVILQVVIDVDGRVIDAAVLRGHPLLNQAALDAVNQWEFTPTLLNGQPVQIQMSVTINFTLS
jgi:TonB family protein